MAAGSGEQGSAEGAEVAGAEAAEAAEAGTAQGTRRRRRVAVAAGAVVVVVALAVLLWPDGGRKAVPPPPAPSSPAPSPSPSPVKALPYPYFLPGTCLDLPQQSPVITEPEERPCEQPHDGEAVVNVLLPEGLANDLKISLVMRDLCAAPFAESEQRQGGGGPYYLSTLGPDMEEYTKGLRDATCVVRFGRREGDRKLSGHLR